MRAERRPLRPTPPTRAHGSQAGVAPPSFSACMYAHGHGAPTVVACSRRRWTPSDAFGRFRTPSDAFGRRLGSAICTPAAARSPSARLTLALCPPLMAAIRRIDGVYFDPSYLPPGGAPSAHNASEIDHDVEVTGWGVSPRGVPYWTVRNSWGTYWGERGWFRILRGSNHLFIEQDCAWAVVDASALEESLGTHALGDYVTGAQAVPMDADGAVLGRIRREGTGATTATAATSVATAAATPLTSRAPSSHPPSSHPPSSRASRGGGTIVAAGAARAAPAPATDALSTAVVSAVAPGFVLGGCLIALATVVVLTRVTRARGRSTACDEGGGTAGWKRPGTVFYAWKRSDEHIAALLQERAEPLLPAAAAAPSCGGRGAAGSGAVGSMPVR